MFNRPSASRDSESRFRGVAALLFFLSAGISIYHRAKADMTGEPVTWKEEGLPTIIATRGGGLVLWLSMVLCLVYPRAMRWAQMPLPSWIRWGGVGMGTMLIPLEFWMFRSIGGGITPTVATRADHRLVTHGPYRWVRHPLYSIGTGIFLAQSIINANWFVAILSVIALKLILMRLPKEEAQLIARFGDDYREYMQRTGRLLPRLKGVHS
jgi:protein-S-isoprenylcysteine O-methyltransferase Ste14